VLYQNIKDVKIRNLQYKMLHNVYPTRKHLFKWKLSDSPNCKKCNVIETLKHAIWECDIAQNAINKFQLATKLIYPEIETIQFTYEVILLGLYSVELNPKINLDKETKDIINTSLVALKQSLILQRDNKAYIPQDDIKNILIERINIRKYNKKRQYKS
jgi:hypothetical protein